MIDRFLRALSRAGVDTDAVELAEILWVATRRPADLSRGDLTAQGRSSSSAAGSAQPTAPAQEPVDVKDLLLHLVPYDEALDDAVAVRLPTPPALPDRLRLGRALRPLKRRHPVTRLCEFDLDGTIELYGATRLLTPLARPGSERWFDVTLVVDSSPTMDVWAQTTAEFARLLAGHGAFRRVQRLRLSGSALYTDSGQRVHPRQVAGHNGRQLIMVISDCVGTAWYSDELWSILRVWGRGGPVALVQTLPVRLWESTALGPADFRLNSYRPGQPNSGLRVEWPWWSDDSNAAVVPVIELSESDLSRWGRMVMGGGEVSVAGVLAAADHPPPASQEVLSAEERVTAFKSTVSVEAHRLAVFLSAVPIRLPVARMVQYSVLKSRNPVHLAEVFAGGLISRITPIDHRGSPDEVVYDFVAGVRDVLQRSLTRTQILEVLRATARYLEKTVGASANFRALVSGVAGQNAAVQPFAEIGQDLARRLGLSPALPPVPHPQPVGLDREVANYQRQYPRQYRDLEGRHVSMVGVDIEGFGSAARTAEDQLLVRDGIYAALKQAFQEAKIPWQQCEKYDRGDGVMILVPAGVSKNQLVTSLPGVLQEGLAAHNAKNPPQVRIRLRLALHAGEVYDDSNGPMSDSLVFLFRLLESAQAKDELARSTGDLVVLVSEWFFDNVIRHDPDARPDSYRPVRFRTKETAASAWIYLPGDDSVAVQETTSVDGARRTTTDRLADVLLNSDSTGRASLMNFVDALLAIPTVEQESSRRMLLERLRPEIANAVPYSPQSRHHVLGLVTTCMNYQGGLDELLELVRDLEGESPPVFHLDQTVARLVASDRRT